MPKLLLHVSLNKNICTFVSMKTILAIVGVVAIYYLYKHSTPAASAVSAATTSTPSASNIQKMEATAQSALQDIRSVLPSGGTVVAPAGSTASFSGGDEQWTINNWQSFR